MKLSSIKIENERVDDIPLIITQLLAMNIPALIDEYFKVHGNWGGISLGWVITVWLAHILSQASHCMVHVQDWVSVHQHTLEVCTGQTIRPLDWCDDRLSRALRYMSDNDVWAIFEMAQTAGLIRTYRLESKVVRHDSTTVSSFGQVTADGLLQLGHSKDHRPDLGQFKAMLSTLDPLGLPVAINVVPGNKADDPLYLPAIEVTQAILGKGLLHVGDSKLGAIDTRVRIVANGDDYLCPLAKIHQEDLSVYLHPIQLGQIKLEPIQKVNAKGETVTIAEGYARTVTHKVMVEDQSVEWIETQWVVRSFAYAKAQERSLKERLNKALEAINVLTVPRQGKKRPATLVKANQAVANILCQFGVDGLITVECRQIIRTRKVGAYRGQSARTERKRELIIAAEVDQNAYQNACAELGWRVYASSSATLTMTEAVCLYRQEDIIEKIFSRLKGQPFSLRPIFLHRDDHMRGMVRLLILGVSAMVLIESVVRKQLKEKNQTLKLGQVKNARPSAEKLLKEFDDITLNILCMGDQKRFEITSLTEEQRQILTLLNFDPIIYLRFNQILKSKEEMSEC